MTERGAVRGGSNKVARTSTTDFECVCVCVCERERERVRQTDRQTDIDIAHNLSRHERDRVRERGPVRGASTKVARSSTTGVKRACVCGRERERERERNTKTATERGVLRGASTKVARSSTTGFERPWPSASPSSFSSSSAYTCRGDTVRAPYNTTSGRDYVKSLRL